MKLLESIKKDTFKAFKDYQINNLAACTGGQIIGTCSSQHQPDTINTNTSNGWTWHNGEKIDYNLTGQDNCVFSNT